ncbi:hypothetical protein HZB88_04870, partial [archaeon]|nr:hypothetical protein [archaeon]
MTNSIILKQNALKILELCGKYRKGKDEGETCLQIAEATNKILNEIEPKDKGIPNKIKPLSEREKIKYAKMLGILRKKKGTELQKRNTGLIFRTANILFGWLALRIGRKGAFGYLGKKVRQSGIGILPFAYFNLMFLSCFIAFLFAGLLSAFGGYGALLPLIALVVAFTIFYCYPFMLAAKRGRIIDREFPFIVLYLTGLSEEGAVAMFRAGAKAGLAVKPELNAIVNAVEAYGLGIEEAIENAKENCPSSRFRDFLERLSGVLRSEKSAAGFLKEEANIAMYEGVPEKTERNSLPEFRILHLPWIIIGGAVIILDFYYFFDFYYPIQTGILFYAVVLFGVMLMSTGWWMDFIREYKRKAMIETEFVRFVERLNEKGDIKAVIGVTLFEYRMLKPCLIKLANQLKIGIPLKKA